MMTDGDGDNDNDNDKDNDNDNDDVVGELVIAAHLPSGHAHR